MLLVDPYLKLASSALSPFHNLFCEVVDAIQWSAAIFESLIVLSFSVVRLIAIRRPLQVCVVDFSPLFPGPVPNPNPGRLSD